MKDTTRKSLSRWWLLLGVTALAVAGLFALVLVVARTPDLTNTRVDDIFHQSLVVHVDLSVLVWFFTIACMIWSEEARRHKAFITIPYIEEAALISMGLGAALIALSPLAHGEALMSNYIPVLANPVFFIGLSLVLCAVLLMLAHVLLRLPGDAPLSFGAYMAAPATLVALFSFVWAWQQMPDVIEGQQYYDMLFWGGGHVLQFLHAQMCMIAWLLLAAAIAPSFKPSQKLLLVLFSIGPFAALITPLAFVQYGVATQDFRLFFTHMMIGANGIAPAILGLFVLTALLKAERALPAITSSLAMSLLLFGYGGLIGAAIHGENVIIPAHYHGSIVGITLAFMGLAYLWLARFGYGDVTTTRLAFWQPIIYGTGQILHISGLAWSGGYGVLRKTPGGMAHLPLNAKAAMGLMGIGGLLAIIGGFMFVVVVGRAVLQARKP